jgi:hypothetical protein
MYIIHGSPYSREYILIRIYIMHGSYYTRFTIYSRIYSDQDIHYTRFVLHTTVGTIYSTKLLQQNILRYMQRYAQTIHILLWTTAIINTHDLASPISQKHASSDRLYTRKIPSGRITNQMILLLCLKVFLIAVLSSAVPRDKKILRDLRAVSDATTPFWTLNFAVFLPGKVTSKSFKNEVRTRRICAIFCRFSVFDFHVLL